MKQAVHRGTHLAMLLLLASCASVQQGPSSPTPKRARRATPPEDSSAELAERMVRFSTDIADVLKRDTEGENAVSNTYSHQRVLGQRRRLGEPRVELVSPDSEQILASTDCSGLLSFVLNTVSPLHEAVLQSQRRLDEHNHAYSENFTLRERLRPWPRAFVVTQFLRSDYAEDKGFETVPNFEDLQEGDIGAYAMGRYAKPEDESRPKPRDTGHVFVVVGRPTVVDPETEGYDGQGSLADDAVKVISVPVVDSSSIVHFDPDSRTDDKGRFVLPDALPHPRARPGGVGTGTIWLALNEEGRVLQRRLGPRQKYRPVLARAARLKSNISLDGTVLDEGDALRVRVFDSVPSEFEGVPYGDAPVHLSGKGGLRIASGRLVLDGRNDFSGGVTVESAELIAASGEALGTGPVAIRGGSLTLKKPAIARTATLSLADGLGEGAVHLDFKGRNVVQALRIGDTTYRCGTWGGPDSRAKNVDPVFKGQGMLELAGPPEACNPDPVRPPERRSRRRGASKLRASNP